VWREGGGYGVLGGKGAGVVLIIWRMDLSTRELDLVEKLVITMENCCSHI